MTQPETTLISMPQNADAERAVLSCALQWPDECFDVIAATPGGAALFYTPAYRETWLAMTSLRESGQPLDLLTLGTELGNSSKLEQVGGPSALADLMDDVPSKEILPEYLKMIRDPYVERSAIQSFTNAISQLRDPARQATAEDVMTSAVDTLNSLLESATTADDLKEFRVPLLEAIEEVQRRFEDDAPIPGMSTGLPDLDEATNGFPEGKMIILAGLSGGGKTALGLQLVLTMARNGIPAGIFSLEMYAAELALRAIAAESKMDGMKIARGFLSKADFPKITTSAGKLAQLPVWIDDRAGMTISHIQAGVRKLVREHGVRVILVDYLGIIKEPEGSRSRVDAVTKLSGALNQLAKETGVCIIALSQLNRDCEKRPNGRPKKSDLKDSSAIEQDAFGVLLLHEKKDQDEDDEKSDSIVEVDLIVDKWRGGRTGPVPLNFWKPLTTFTTRPPQDPYS